MFGMSFTELLIIAVLALILLGPDKLPDAARSAGKLMRELRRATDDIKDQLETELYADELRKRQAPVAPVPAATQSAEAAAAEPGGKPADPPTPFAGLHALPEPVTTLAPAPAPVAPGEPGEPSEHGAPGLATAPKT